MAITAAHSQSPTILGTCQRSCPPQAIITVNQWRVVDYGQCTRCFCCQELCPQRAVTIHHSWLGRAILRAREAR